MRASLVVSACLFIAACGKPASLPVAAGIGPEPELPAPESSLFPTINVAPAVGWQDGRMPHPADGAVVSAFARNLEHPRWLYQLPNGDVLVAETNTPKPHDKKRGLKAKVESLLMKRAGSGRAPSADRITLLRDSDGDGNIDLRSVFIEGLRSPFGMALVGNDLYVANTDAVMRFPYRAGEARSSSPGTVLTQLPAGEINHHWTKSLIASADGSKLYVGVGSNSNVAETGMQVEEGRAAIWEIDVATGKHRIFASGLRNPVGMAWAPDSGALWVTVNERDALGSDLVPDYMTEVRDGAFYGWPYSYYGQHIDERVSPQNAALVARAVVPDFALGAHTASLGLYAATQTNLPSPFQQGMFVGQHGSWNRKPHSGYKVIFVPFKDGKPSGIPTDVLTGFLNEKGEAQGRPVGVLITRQGDLLVADDVGNVIWRVTGASSLVAARAVSQSR
jgi:glucose/arabinose dehydrogenase